MVLGEEEPEGPIGTTDASCDECALDPIRVQDSSRTRQHGGSGGDPSTDLCPGNQVIIGFQGWLTPPEVGILLIGGIQALCGELTLGGPQHDQVVVAPGQLTPLRGLARDAYWTRMCPPDAIVVGFNGRSGIAVDQLTFQCAHWFVASTPTGTTLSSELPTPLDPIGGTGGSSYRDGCPLGQMARGTDVRSDQWVDAFGLICGAPSIHVDASAPPPIVDAGGP